MLSLITVAASSSQSVHLTSIVPSSSIISTPHPIVSQVVTQLIPTNPISTPPLRPNIMASRYAPQVLPTQLHNIPQDYQTRIPQFDGAIPVTAQHHIDKMNDFFNLHEVDDNDVKLRIFL